MIPKLKDILFENKKAKNGDCYEAAGRLAIEGIRGLGVLRKYKDKIVLVHGVVLNSLDYMPMSHAWVEVGNTCYDYSNGRKLKISKSKYYHSGAIDGLLKKGYKQHRYKGMEVAEMVLKNKHWGPWKNLGVNR